jgi:secondary thiamine-phosphate synthase enzyme
MAQDIQNESTTIEFPTRGGCQIVDVTDQVQDFLEKTGVEQGLVTVSVIGSTGGITTIEHEPGLIRDLPELMDKLIPEGSYHHDQTWHDGNGHSHLRSALIGTSQTFPVLEGKAALGTWQQIIFVEFDNKPRRRQVVIQYLGS